MKKNITVIVIVILLLNLISIKSFAFDTDEPLDTSPQETGKVTLINDDGEDLLGNISGTTYSEGIAFKGVINVLTVLPQVANQVLESFVEVTTDKKISRYTIYDTVMGNFDLFNINYLDIPSEVDDDSPLIDLIKYNVLKYYSIIRNLSIAISLLVLIYIGIRMAASTVANDKAKYKKMLVNWIASLMLVFIMHFIVIIISFILQEGLEIVNNIAASWGVTEFEQDIYSGAIENLTVTGFNIFTSFIIIYLLTYYQIKFFIYYLERTLEVNFLILVSPLVTITYSIDKCGDNKAQAFEAFLKELIMKSAVQILHAIVYVVFIASAGVIASTQPILAIVFFAVLSRAEKIARKIFTIDEDGFERVKVPFID